MVVVHKTVHTHTHTDVETIRSPREHHHNQDCHGHRLLGESVLGADMRGFPGMEALLHDGLTSVVKI
jgi:hypothetical protein